MIAFRHGDVVLVRFVFSDESGVKLRPTLVVSTERYHTGRREAIVAAITSNVKRVLHGDHEVRAWSEAGLLYPSVVTGIIRTIKRDMIAATLGHVAEADLVAVKGRFREIVDL